MIVSPSLQVAALYHPATDHRSHIQPFLPGLSTGEHMTRSTIIGCRGAWEGGAMHGVTLDFEALLQIPTLLEDQTRTE